MSVEKKVLLSIVAVILAVGAAFGIGYLAVGMQATVGRDSLNVGAENRRRGYEYQQTLRSTAQEKVAQFYGLTAESPQAKAIRNQVCGLLANAVGELPTDLNQFQFEECP